MRGDPDMALAHRIARLQGWTAEQLHSQPFEYILAIAADHLLENEEVKSHRGASTPPGPGATGRGGTQTTVYKLKPKNAE
jgi:hypothetical protein